MEAIHLHDSSSGSSATILPSLGFNCTSWKVAVGDATPREMLLTEPGFELGDKRTSGSGIPILFPHPGRIAGGKFRFQGKEYTLPLSPGHPNALHGFVLSRPWRVIDQTSTRVSAEFQPSIDDLSVLDMWPSDFLFRATYELTSNDRDKSRLVCDLEVENVGGGPLPWGLGTHTYFRLPLQDGSQPEATLLTAPIVGEWELIDMLASGRQLPLPPELTFAEGVPLEGRQFDNMYRLAERAGEMATTLSDPTCDWQITQTFSGRDFPNLVIYTPGHRQAICMEPYSCAADPFQLEELGIDSGLRILEPGQGHATRITLAIEPRE